MAKPGPETGQENANSPTEVLAVGRIGLEGAEKRALLCQASLGVPYPRQRQETGRVRLLEARGSAGPKDSDGCSCSAENGSVHRRRAPG